MTALPMHLDDIERVERTAQQRLDGCPSEPDRCSSNTCHEAHVILSLVQAIRQRDILFLNIEQSLQSARTTARDYRFANRIEAVLHLVADGRKRGVIR